MVGINRAVTEELIPCGACMTSTINYHAISVIVKKLYADRSLPQKINQSYTLTRTKKDEIIKHIMDRLAENIEKHKNYIITLNIIENFFGSLLPKNTYLDASMWFCVEIKNTLDSDKNFRLISFSFTAADANSAIKLYLIFVQKLTNKILQKITLPYKERDNTETADANRKYNEILNHINDNRLIPDDFINNKC